MNTISPVGFSATSPSSTGSSGIGLPRLQGLADQAMSGTPAQQTAAKAELHPVLMNSMQEWLQQHPGSSPEDFMQALDNGQVSASDMGLYGRHDPLETNNQLQSTEKQLHTLLQEDPTYAASLGITGTNTTK